jgi:nucleoside 2-deoxyribosyltransferase
MAITLYLAGGLFNAGERLHNLMLEKHLKKLGYEVVLPQREAKKFFDGTAFDIHAVMKDCQQHSCDSGSMLIGNLDGADADSGTAVEIGIAVTATGRAIVYRTDFRTDPERELGVNAMLRLTGTKFIYEPCTFTELVEADAYYERLATKIHEWIPKLFFGCFEEQLTPQKNA